MTDNTRIVFFIFAGRKANMEIQRPYIERLLGEYPKSELHLWDLTREESDQIYLRQWAASHERIAFVAGLHPGHPIECAGDWRGPGHRRCQCIKHKPPYEDPYRYYRDNPVRGGGADYTDATVFVKLDDDVLWMDTDRFGEVLSFLETHPAQIASANVINNVVCAKYEPSLREQVLACFAIPSTNPNWDRTWWALHTSAVFALLSHRWAAEMFELGFRPDDREPVQTRFGEAVSINFVAMKYPMLCAAADRMDDVENPMGDEGTIDSFLPWIIPNFRVAHLSFGPQEHDLDPETVEAIRKQYRIEGAI